MPQRLISNNGRDWGKETRMVSTLRMSRRSLLSTRVKNQHETNRLGQEVGQIHRKMENEEIRHDKDIRRTREQLRRFVASSRVFKEHSFDRYDPFLRQKSARRDVTNIPGYQDDRYWRAMEAKEKEPVVIETNPKNKWASVISKSSSKVTEGTGTQRRENDAKKLSERLRTFVDVKNKPNLESNNNWSIDKTFKESKVMSAKSMFETFLKNANQDNMKNTGIPRIRRREKTFTYTRDRTIFAGQCKTTWELRKFMEQEVTCAVFSMSPEGQRRANIERLKAKAKLPSLVQRSKTTSAILKDFRTFKEQSRLMTAGF
ncbi:hypothetical protein FSP39_014961 [Pinctada imbricata]|uniref:Uncharacterized protein n=1 Tax=Pinctada imbricata TaxID=66713 RepID=A0AA88YCV0_PINIB|nr:hypothetical protein FSP39_014961 [Pinctada imbricata]